MEDSFQNLMLTGVAQNRLGIPRGGRVIDLTRGDGASDTSGNGNDPALLSGHSVTLDGVGDNITFPATSATAIAGTTKTITIYVRVSAFPAASEAILGRGGVGTGGDGGYAVFLTTAGAIQAITRNASVLLTSVVSDGNVIVDEWNKISVTFSGRVVDQIKINDVVQDLTVLTDVAGTYVDSADVFRIGARGTGGVASSFFAGDVADLNVLDAAGSVTLSALLNEHPSGTLDGKPAFDRSGNGNHGTIVGGEGNVGEAAPVPQTALMDWNKRMWFDGVDDEIDLGAPLIPATGDFDVSGSFRLPDIGTGPTNEVLLSQFQGVTDGRFAVAADSTVGLQVVINHSSGNVLIQGGALENNQVYTWRVARVSGTLTAYLDGVSVGSDSSGRAIMQTQNTNIGGNALISKRTKGLLFNYDIDGTLWDGSLKGAIANGWTVNGSPANIYLPASLATTTEDALGNDIDNPRGNLLNHTGIYPDRVEIPYDPSLNVTTAFELFVWGNFYIDDGVAQTKRFVDRWDTLNDKRSWLFARSLSDVANNGKCRFLLSVNGLLSYAVSFTVSNTHSLLRFQFIGGTSFKVWEYNSGSWTELTVTTETGTIPASLFTTDIPIKLPGTFNTGDPDESWEGQMFVPAFYNRVLTDAEADKVRRVSEPRYGA